MPIIWARNPAFNRISQVNPNGPTLLKPTRWPIGGSRPPEYVLEERFDANNELVFRDDFNAGNVEIFRDSFNRSDIAPWTNGDGSRGVVSISSGRIRVENTTGTFARATLEINSTVGKWLRLTFADFDADNSSSGTDAIDCGYSLTSPNGASPILISPRPEKGDPPKYIELYVEQPTFWAVIQVPGNLANEWVEVGNFLIEEIPALDGWVPYNAPVVEIIANQARVESTGEPVSPRITKAVASDINAHYLASGYLLEQSAQPNFAFSNNADGSAGFVATGAVGTGDYELNFAASAATTYAVLAATTTTNGQGSSFDNIQLERIRALDGWEASNAQLSIESGALRVAMVTTGAGAYATKAVTTETGKNYIARAAFLGGIIQDNEGRFRAGALAGGSELMNIVTSASPQELMGSFQASGTTTYISATIISSVSDGEYGDFDNITVEPSGLGAGNDTFDSDLAGHTVISGKAVWDAGTALITGNGSGETLQTFISPALIGKRVLVEFRVSAKSAADIWTAFVFVGGSIIDASLQFTAPGVYQMEIPSLGTSPRITWKGSATENFNLDWVTAREVSV